MATSTNTAIAINLAVSANATSTASSNDRATSTDMPSFPRFLDLPIELRLMVYEYISPVTTQRKLDLQAKFSTEYEFDVTVMKQSLSTAILATCRLVRQEAEPILLKSLAALEQQPLHAQCSMEDLYQMHELAKARGLIPINEQSSMSLILGYIITLHWAYWDHVSKIARTSPQSPHHLEIAVTTPPTFPSTIPLVEVGTVWSMIFCDALEDEVSCAVYHKGILQPIPGSHQPPTGMGFWQSTRSMTLAIANRSGMPSTDGVDPDSIVKVVEMGEEEWERMVEGWKTK